MRHHLPFVGAALALVLVSPPRAQALQEVGKEEATLVASDAAELDYFGRAVAVSGDTVAVGARLDDHDGGVDAGSAYVFVRGTGGWTQQARLVAADAAAGDGFGASVDVSGDTVVVGAAFADVAGGVDAGAAYVFVRSGTDWTQQAKLTAADAAADDRFGTAIAIAGDTVLVGAYKDDAHFIVDAGSVHVFVRSGTTWTEQAVLKASDAAASDFFGISVAISGDTALVGALFNDFPGASDAGAAYVFVRSGTTWTQQTELTASNAAAGDNFGIAVALSGDTALVGADAVDDPVAGDNAGAAYVFVRSGTSWTQQAILASSDEGEELEGASLGRALALSHDVAVVGTYGYNLASGVNDGSAYVYVRNGTSWAEVSELEPGADGEDDDFGIAVALSGDTTVIGSVSDDQNGVTNCGSATVFTLGGFTNLGGGLAGIAGIPELTGTGSLVVGSSGSLSLATHGLATASILLVSAGGHPHAFKGGVVHTVPFFLQALLPTSANGAWTLPWPSWPAGLAPGDNLSFETLVVDPSALQGVAISNLLRATQPLVK